MERLEERALLSGNPTLYSVTDLSDSAADTGSLRSAITQANADPNPAGSLIQFDATVFSSPQTITLASTLELSETAGPEVIDGPGAGTLTISGNDAVRVFLVDQGVTATISNLTISGGSVLQPDHLGRQRPGKRRGHRQLRHPLGRRLHDQRQHRQLRWRFLSVRGRRRRGHSQLGQPVDHRFHDQRQQRQVRQCPVL